MKLINKTAVITAAIAGLMCSSCNDTLTKVGTTIQPSEDLITVYTDTFTLEAETVLLDSVFAKTTTCLLGEMYDPVYGNIKADFLCQFYCEEGYTFSPVPYEDRIDSLVLFVMYNNGSWYGDTLTPMQATIYPVVNPLKRNFYSNDDPTKYCDMAHPLGSVVYTAYDRSISDSVHQITDTSDSLYYTPHVRVLMPQELGQKLLDATLKDPAAFATQEAFNELFPGIYVTTTFGSGNLIQSYGEYIFLRFYYQTLTTGSEDQDTVVHTYSDFTVPKEVVQINRFTNSRLEELLTPNPDYTHVKSPAGVCTRLTVPTTEISKHLDVSERFINAFSINLKFVTPDEYDFAYSPPSYLLLLPEDSVRSFFEGGKTEDNTVSFVSYDGSSSSSSTYTTQAGYATTNYTYYFGNLSPLLKRHIELSPDEDLRLLVVPVNRTSSVSSSYYSSSSTVYTTSITNSFALSGAKIRTDGDYMKVIVVSSKFE